MAAESEFVAFAHSLANDLLADPFQVVRGHPLLYELTVDNNLKVMNPEAIRNPKRGSSAFQTDLCILERRSAEVSIPRVVIEFKTRITTHDVLTYSSKALKHKTIYPYLRYGMLASDESLIPGRVFTHNEGLDFFAAVKGMQAPEFKTFFLDLIEEEIQNSRTLERIAFGAVPTRLYRTSIHVRELAF